jgi:peptidylprolyl isomerase/peptidyl-prolyl cis-trans isomerase C
MRFILRPRHPIKPTQQDKGPYVMKVVSAFRASNPLATARAGTAAILLAAVLGTTGQTFAQSPAADRVVAVVNGTPIHESDIKVTDDIVGRNLNSQDPVERHDIILKMYIDTLLLSKVANDRKIVDDADLQRRVTFARNQGLMNHLLVTVGQQAVSDASIRKTYEDVVVKAANNEPELHLRHIFFLFKDPKDDAAVKEAGEKANAALKRIKAGEDFAAVAADVSEDPITKAKGGDFEWRGRAEMGEEYAAHQDGGRMAHHQGRGSALAHADGPRQNSRQDRGDGRGQRPVRIRRQAALRGQDRTFRRAGRLGQSGAEAELSGRMMFDDVPASTASSSIMMMAGITT